MEYGSFTVLDEFWHPTSDLPISWRSFHLSKASRTLVSMATWQTLDQNSWFLPIISPSGAILACSSAFAAASSLPSGQRSSTRPISRQCFRATTSRRLLAKEKYNKKEGSTNQDEASPGLGASQYSLGHSNPAFPDLLVVQPKKLHWQATPPIKYKLSYTNIWWPS